MTRNDIDTVKAFEEQIREEEEYERKKKLDEEYNEAKQSATFNVFNSVIGVITALASASFVFFFLWKNNKILLLIVAVLVVTSIVFGMLAKHHFQKGDRKKFEVYNRLSGATGVASSIFELADMRNSKSKGALNKVDGVTHALTEAKQTVAEVQFRGGTYTDKKYDSIRSRAIGTGKFIYRNQTLDGINHLIKTIESSNNDGKMSRGDSVKLGVVLMYVKDVMDKNYGCYDDVFYACLGALYYFTRPLKELPDNVPLVGYKDNMFVPYCVYAGFDKKLDVYKKWKIEFTKKNMVDEALNNVDEIWRVLCTVDMTESTSISDLVAAAVSYVDDNRDVGKEIIDAVIVLSKILRDWDSGEYVNVSKEVVDGIANTLSYIIIEDDAIPDKLSALGYVDDFVIAKCCLTMCADVIKDYKVWEQLEKLKEESDPLIEYLNTVIGSDDRLRENEIKRLSKLCHEDKITDVNERARIVVKDLQI